MAEDILTVVQNNVGKSREEMDKQIRKTLADYFRNKKDQEN